MDTWTLRARYSLSHGLAAEILSVSLAWVGFSRHRRETAGRVRVRAVAWDKPTVEARKLEYEYDYDWPPPPKP